MRAMPSAESTIEESRARASERAPAIGGVVKVFSRGQAACDARPVLERLVVGRATGDGFDIDDDRLSRRHFRIEVSMEGASRFVVADEGSRNGTWVEGKMATPNERRTGAVVRAGRSVFLLVDDVRRFTEGMTQTGDVICGPTLAVALRRVERLAAQGRTLSLHGESGSGKELAARAFHEATGGGAFIAVNCAAIPEGMAERLLFGTKRGAYSGAQTDAEGWIAAADRGTLFLDEIAELDPKIQSKLLRVLEQGEVMPLGAARPTKVSFRLCVATHKDLRAEAARGRFREDLFYRIGVDAVRLPALRERREDIPALVVREARRASPDLEPDATLIEACMCRTWPGNVRELVAEVRVAAGEALAKGRKIVDADDLAEDAGRAIARSADVMDAAREHRADDEPTSDVRGASPSDEAIEKRLRACGGNVTRAARELGMHRNQLRRWLLRRPDARDLTESPELGLPSDPEPES